MQNSTKKEKKDFEGCILPQFKKPRRTLTFEHVKSQIIKLIREKNYDLLSSWLQDNFSSQEAKNTFFSENGHKILRYILANFDDLYSLKFIEQSFSDLSIKIALQNDNFNAIEGFFLAMGGSEMFQNDDDLHRKMRIETLKFILRYGEETLRIFLTENINARFMSPKVQEDCAIADRGIKSNNTALQNKY